MPDTSFHNVKYALPGTAANRFVTFESIWKVLADPTYRVRNERGFDNPAFFMTYAGNGTLEIPAESETWDLGPNSVFFIRPNRPCRYFCPAGNTWHFYFITWEEPALIEDIGLRFHTPYSLSTPDMITRTGEAVISELIRQQPGYALAVENRTRELLIETVRSAGKTESDIAGILHWMHYNLGKNISIGEVRQYTGLGRTRLFSVFRKVTGKTPLEYFLDLKLDSARLLLETTVKTAGSIAEGLGFYDEYHFSRLYKKKYGLPPGKWRKEYRKR